MRKHTDPADIIPCELPTGKCFQDLTGKTFEYLTVESFAGKRAKTNGNWEYFWKCLCRCGAIIFSRTASLNCGNTQSCGCRTIINLIGRRFGRLTVIGPPEHGPSGILHWPCVCDCGKHVTPPGQGLRNGSSKSCGCYQKDIQRKLKTTHGTSRLAERRIWKAMIRRCTNDKFPWFFNYGGRGIKVCKRWLNSFQEWREDMGPRPAGMSIDRKDNDGNYSCGKCQECFENGWPMNCRWATPKEQANNSRGNVWLEHAGEKHTIQQWADKTGLSFNVIWQRLFKFKWTAERALTTPKAPRKPRKTHPHPVGPLVQASLF